MDRDQIREAQQQAIDRIPAKPDLPKTETEPPDVIEIASDDEYDDTNGHTESEVLIVGENRNAQPLTTNATVRNNNEDQNDDVIITNVAAATTGLPQRRRHEELADEDEMYRIWRERSQMHGALAQANANAEAAARARDYAATGMDPSVTTEMLAEQMMENTDSESWSDVEEEDDLEIVDDEDSDDDSRDLEILQTRVLRPTNPVHPHIRPERSGYMPFDHNHSSLPAFSPDTVMSIMNQHIAEVSPLQRARIVQHMTGTWGVGWFSNDSNTATGEDVFRQALGARFGEGLRWLQSAATGNAPAFGNDVERSIMERIERDNEREADRRLERENAFNRKALLEKNSQIKKEVPGYTSDIHTDSNIGCELCGVTLGEGIPNEFKTSTDLAKDLVKYQDEFEVAAPWFCSNQVTEVDKDLSKRVFLAKCGHLYCGRCIKNIGNRPKGRISKKLQATMDDPRVTAPALCAATACSHKFRGKRSFTELYF